MRRPMRAALVLALVTAVAGAAVAYAFEFNRYQGHVKGDDESHVGFDIERTPDGHRRVVDFLASGLDFTCEKGSPGQTTGVGLTRTFRIRRDRTFGGRADAVILGFDPPARLTGELRRHGRVVGTIRAHGELDPEGQPGVDCNTGRLEWRARKVPPLRRRG